MQSVDFTKPLTLPPNCNTPKNITRVECALEPRTGRREFEFILNEPKKFWGQSECEVSSVGLKVISTVSIESRLIRIDMSRSNTPRDIRVNLGLRFVARHATSNSSHCCGRSAPMCRCALWLALRFSSLSFPRAISVRACRHGRGH